MPVNIIDIIIRVKKVGSTREAEKEIDNLSLRSKLANFQLRDFGTEIESVDKRLPKLGLSTNKMSDNLEEMRQSGLLTTRQFQDLHKELDSLTKQLKSDAARFRANPIDFNIPTEKDLNASFGALDRFVRRLDAIRSRTIDKGAFDSKGDFDLTARKGGQFAGLINDRDVNRLLQDMEKVRTSTEGVARTLGDVRDGFTRSNNDALAGLTNVDRALTRIIVKLRQEAAIRDRVNPDAATALRTQSNQVESLRGRGTTLDEVRVLARDLPALRAAIPQIENEERRLAEQNRRLAESLALVQNRLRAQRGEFGLFSRVAANVRESVGSLTRAFDQSPLGKNFRRVERSIFGEAVSDAEKDVKRFEQTVSNSVNTVGRTARGFDKVGDEITKVGGAAGGAGGNVRGFGRDLNDLTPIDETIGIGFARIARFFAVVIGILPLAATAFGLLDSAVVALAGGVTELIGALSTLTGLLATLPVFAATAIGAFSAIALVFAPAVKTITDRVTEIIHAQDQARKNFTRNNEELKNSLENLADVRKSNAAQLRDVDQQEQDTKRKSAEQEKDAENDLQRLRVRNAEQVADLKRRGHETQLRDLEQIKNAEERLRDIRKRNTQEEARLAQDVLQRRAELQALRVVGANAPSIAAAQARLDQAEQAKQLFATSDEKRQESTAERAVAKAKRDLTKDRAELRRDLRRLIRDNEQQEQDVIQRLHRLQRDNAQQLIDLERSRSNIIRTNAKQERDALDRLRTARRRVAGDIGNPLRGLPKVEQDLVNTILRIRSQFKILTGDLKRRGEVFLLEVLRTLEPHLPEITKLIDKFGQVILDFAKAAFDRFSSPENVKKIVDLFEEGVPILEDFAAAVLDIIDALISLGDAARPLAREISGFVRSAASSINSSVQRNTRGTEAPGLSPSTRGEAVRSGAGRSNLSRSLQETDVIARILGRTLGNLFDAFRNILRIAEPFGRVLLQSFERFSKRVDNFTKSQSGRNSIRAFFADVTPVVRELLGLASDAAKVLFLIGRDLFRPSSGQTGRPGGFLLEAVEGLRKRLPGFRQFIVQLTTKDGPALIKFLREITKAIEELVGTGGAFITLFGVLGDVLHLFNALPGPIKRFAVTFIALGGIAAGVAKSVRGMRAAFSELRTIGSLARFLTVFERFFGGRFKLLLITLLAFPGIIKTVFSVIDGIFRGITTLLGPLISLFDRLNEATGGWFGNVAQGAFLLVSLRGTVVAAAKSLKELALATSLMVRTRLATAVTAMSFAVDRFKKALIACRGVMIAFRATAIATFISNPYVLAVLAIVAVLVLLDRKFHFIIPTVRLIGRALKALLDIFIDLGHKVGKGLATAFDGVRTALSKVADFLKNNWQTILIAAFLGPFAAIGFLLRHRFEQLGRDAIDAVRRGITNISSAFSDALEGIGRDIVNGIWQGIKQSVDIIDNLARWVKDQVVKKIKDAFHIFSPSQLMADEVGEPLAQGVLEGFRGADIGSAMARDMRTALGKVTAAIRKSKGDFSDAFSSLTQEATSSFDQLSGAKVGPAAKRLTSFEAADTVRQRKKSIDEANKEGNEARASERNARFKIALSKRLAKVADDADADGRKKDAARTRARSVELRKQGNEQLTQALSDEKNANEQLADVARQATHERLQKQAETEKAQQQKRDETQRFLLERDLSRLQTGALRKAEKGKFNANAFQKNVLAVLAKYGISYDKVGATLGTAYAQALAAKITLVQTSAKRINRAVIHDLTLKQTSLDTAIRRPLERLIAGIKPVIKVKITLDDASVTQFEKDRARAVAAARAGVHPSTGPNAPPEPRRQFVVGDPRGLVRAGNIDISHPPTVVKTKSGGVSTVRSETIEVDGKFILIPTVAGGKELSPEEAVRRFMRTGKNLGSFDSEKAADAYAEMLHAQQLQVLRAWIRKHPKRAHQLGIDQSFAKGGPIRGTPNAATPILAHAGEWVLNFGQQARAAAMMGMNPGQLSKALFERRTVTPKLSFASGGIVPSLTLAAPATSGTTVNQEVNIHTSSEKADVDYVARVLQSRMGRF